MTKPKPTITPEETPEPEAIEVTTAYVTVIDKAGSVAIIPDLSIKFTVLREPTPEDILGSAAVVKASIEGRITAASTQAVLLQQAKNMAKQQSEQQALHQIQGG